MRVIDRTLQIRSRGHRERYLGEGHRRCARLTASSIPATASSCAPGGTISRAARGGVINVGGQKVHPEEIEAVHQRASMGAHVAGEGTAQRHHRCHRHRRGRACR